MLFPARSARDWLGHGRRERSVAKQSKSCKRTPTQMKSGAPATNSRRSALDCSTQPKTSPASVRLVVLRLVVLIVSCRRWRSGRWRSPDVLLGLPRLQLLLLHVVLLLQVFQLALLVLLNLLSLLLVYVVLLQAFAVAGPAVARRSGAPGLAECAAARVAVRAFAPAADSRWNRQEWAAVSSAAGRCRSFERCCCWPAALFTGALLFGGAFTTRSGPIVDLLIRR